MTAAVSAASYEVFPLQATPDRASVVSKVLRKVASQESVFSDEQRGCEDGCFERDLSAMCERCRRCMGRVAAGLLRPDCLVWEVWRTEPEPELVGVMRVGSVRPGEDAICHYVFFDHSLAGKTGVLKQVIGWLFEDHPESGWIGLKRLTVEIPDFAFALARHASRKLGFGGPFTYKPEKGSALAVEGVRRSALEWRGSRRDVLILGLLNEKEQAV